MHRSTAALLLHSQRHGNGQQPRVVLLALLIQARGKGAPTETLLLKELLSITDCFSSGKEHSQLKASACTRHPI